MKARFTFTYAKPTDATKATTKGADPRGLLVPGIDKYHIIEDGKDLSAYVETGGMSLPQANEIREYLKDKPAMLLKQMEFSLGLGLIKGRDGMLYATYDTPAEFTLERLHTLGQGNTARYGIDMTMVADEDVLDKLKQAGLAIALFYAEYAAKSMAEEGLEQLLQLGFRLVG